MLSIEGRVIHCKERECEWWIDGNKSDIPFTFKGHCAIVALAYIPGSIDGFKESIEKLRKVENLEKG